MEVLAIGIAAIAAVAAWRSASAAHKAAAEAHKATQASLVNDILASYSSPEMLKCIANLLDWEGEAIQPGSGVDRSRRVVAHHFQRIYLLAKANLLNEDALRIVAAKDQVALIAVPLSKWRSSAIRAMTELVSINLLTYTEGDSTCPYSHGQNDWVLMLPETLPNKRLQLALLP